MKFLLVFSMLIFGICSCWEDVPRFFTNGHAGYQFYHASREEPKEQKFLKIPQKQEDNKVEEDVQTADSIIRKNYVLPPRNAHEKPKKVIKVYKRKLAKPQKIEKKIAKISTQTKRELYARKPSDKFMKLHSRNSKNSTRPQRHIPYYFRRQGLYL